MKNWRIHKVTQATQNKSLFTFVNGQGNWFITVFAKELEDAYMLLARRIQKEQDAIDMRKIGSRHIDTIDDWLAIEFN